MFLYYIKTIKKKKFFISQKFFTLVKIPKIKKDLLK